MQEFIEQFIYGLRQTTALEFIAVVAGIAIGQLGRWLNR